MTRGSDERPPVTVLCGALGAGKTTLLSTLLERTDREIAVVVNDVGEVNVDGDLVAARSDLSRGEELVTLENGCICCSLGGDLSRTVIDLWKRHEFDALVIEASGVGKPEPIAHQFARGPAAGPYDLDSVTTVVDARRFHDAFVEKDGAVRFEHGGPGVGNGGPGVENEATPDREESAPEPRGPVEDGTRPLADLTIEQVEFCDQLVVNKCDLVTEGELSAVVSLLETLQPAAELVTTEFGALDPECLLDTGRFDLSDARVGAGWKRAIEADGKADDRSHGDVGPDEARKRSHDSDDALGYGRDADDTHGHDADDRHGAEDHRHPPERYGVVVDTYHRRRPFHPERFTDLLTDLPDELVRAKGLCWVAGRERAALTMSYAPGETTVECTGRWIASFPEERRETYRASQPDLSWDETWGDRESRLALIGRHLDIEDLTDRLDGCLLTDEEMDDDWSTFENPTPTAVGETVRIVEGERHEDPSSTGD